MFSTVVKKIALNARLLASVTAMSVAVSSCGGGGGGDSASQPAPQTMNALVLTLYTGGITLTFTRAEGDASGSGETGAVTMTENPGPTQIVDSGGMTRALLISDSISGARYTYTRTAPEQGILVITGSGSGTDSESAATPSEYFQAPTFTRQYDLVFGTDGAVITGLIVQDTGETTNIQWTDAQLRVFGGGAVPIGWNVEVSNGISLPKIYPDGLNQQQFVITPDDLLESEENYIFLNSTFTRFSDVQGDFLEEGVGNRQIPPDPTQTVINFIYQPDPDTTNRAVLRIFSASSSEDTYTLTFLDFEKGTYVKDDGTTGTFELPFLEET